MAERAERKRQKQNHLGFLGAPRREGGRTNRLDRLAPVLKRVGEIRRGLEDPRLWEVDKHFLYEWLKRKGVPTPTDQGTAIFLILLHYPEEVDAIIEAWEQSRSRPE